MAKLRHLFKGYLYQDLATAIQFGAAILGKVDQITVDTKLHTDDLFDDLAVFAGHQSVRRQFKYSDDASRQIQVEDLRTNRVDLRIDRVCRLIKADGSSMAGEYRICGRWGATLAPELSVLLEPITAESSFPGYSTNVFSIRLERLWPSSGPTFGSVAKHSDLSRSDYAQMCRRLRLELGCPAMSADLDRPGPAEDVLLRMLADEIGIGRFPNQHLDPTDAAARLVFEANSARSTGRQITAAAARQMLRLRTDYGRVAQRFPVREAERIEFGNVVEVIKNHLAGSQRLLVVGSPGSGKSWALTRLADKLRKTKAAVARHYCYISVNDADSPKRILTETLYGNLAASLFDAAPDLRQLNRPLFASGAIEFQELLHRIHSSHPEQNVVLIVDGLDHVARIRSFSGTVSEAESNIIAELAQIELPPNVKLILGSQPGEHVGPLRANSVEITMPRWNEGDTRAFLKRVSVLEDISQAGYARDADAVVTTLHERSAGNPLYTWYLANELRISIANREARSPIDILVHAPAYDSDLNAYYSHLITHGGSSSEVLGKLLACIDFGITRAQIGDIWGPGFAMLVDSAVDGLRPVLDETASQGGVRIYHDSFRRFMLSRLGSGSAVAAALAPVISWLRKRDFFNDALAYRFLVPCLRRAARIQEIVELVQPQFTWMSVSGGHWGEAVLANLRELAWAAAHTRDLAALAACAELHSASWTAFEDHLPFRIREYGEAFAAVFGAAELSERLLLDGTPTVDQNAGLVLCHVCDVNGAAAPWAEYLASVPDPGEGDGVEAIVLAEFVGRMRLIGFDKLEPKIRRFIASERPSGSYLRGVLREIARLEGVAGLARLADVKIKTKANRAIVEMVLAEALEREGDPAGATAHAERAAQFDPEPHVLLEVSRRGVPREAVGKIVASRKALRLVEPPNGKRFDRPEEHSRWIALIQVHAMLGTPPLIQLRAAIAERGWYPAWLRFVIDLSIAEVEATAERGRGARRVLAALEELATFDKPFEGSPRAVDLYMLHPVIADTIGRALSLIDDEEHWTLGMFHISRISRNTTTHIQGQRGFTGPLSQEMLARLLVEYANHSRVSTLAIESISRSAKEVEAKGEYYSVMADHGLMLAQAYGAQGRHEEGRQAWAAAARAMCAYGWRKDRTVWKSFKGTPALSALSKERALRALERAQPLAHRVLLCTDGSETKHAPNAWFRSLARTDPVHAAMVLGRSCMAEGGTWHWRWEDALGDLLEVVNDVGDPALLLMLASGVSAEAEAHRVTRSLRLAERICQQNPEWAPRALSIVECMVVDDSPSPDREAARTLVELGKQAGVTISRAAMLLAAENDNVTPVADAEMHVDGSTDHLAPRFSPSATPFELLSAIRMRPQEFGSSQNATSFVNPLGYRLLGFLERGDVENVSRILKCFGKEWRYSGSGQALSKLGEGFERHGHRDAAAVAFALAYRHLRTRDNAHLLQRAIDLNRELAISVTIDEYVEMFQGEMDVSDISTQLLYLAVAIGEVEQAFQVQEATTSVIDERLWGSSESPVLFHPYAAAEMPETTLNRALCFLLLCRISHPDNHRRHTALASICELLKSNCPWLPWAVAEVLSLDCLCSTAVVILDAAWRFGHQAFASTENIKGVLQSVTFSDQFVAARRAGQILERADPQRRVRFTVPELGVCPPVTPKRARAILSVDRSNRIALVERVWSGATDVLVGEFDRLWKANEELNVRRMRQRMEASRGHAPAPVEHGQFHHWEAEFFEIAFERVLSRLPLELFRRGMWETCDEAAISEMASPRVNAYAARMFNRVARPPHPLPEKVTDSIADIESVQPDGPFSGWLILGRYETQVRFRDALMRSKPELITAMSGACVVQPLEQLHEVAVPFGSGNWRQTGETSDASQKRGGPITAGPLVVLDETDTFLGAYPMLWLSARVASWIQCTADPVAPLELFDSDGKIAVAFQCWFSGGKRDGRDDRNYELAGCQLLMQPNLFARMEKATAGEVRVVTRTSREDLSVE